MPLARHVGPFVLCAFVFTWTVHGILIASGMTVVTGRTLYRIGLLGPLVAALTITWKLGGWPEATTFLLRGVQLGGALLPCACALLLAPLVYALAALSVGDGLPALVWPAVGPLGVLGAQTWVVICEEPGWRGFGWPALQTRLGPIASGCALGLIWAAWHVPMFFMEGSRQQGSFAEFALIVVAWTMIMGALVNRGSGSFLPALTFHFSANVCAYVFPLGESADARAIALWIAVGLVAACDLWLQDKRGKARP